MTSTLGTDWTTHARRLADTLQANGDLRSPQWHAAVSAVPRHLLVPRAYQQDDTGTWSEFETATALERVYSTETLVTALETVGAHRLPISSSTKPDLMVRMLEILDVHDGHRVLEIGTGSGYNAALLAHRLGGDRVFSIDVGDDLVDLARRRLHTVGFHPTLMVGDRIPRSRRANPRWTQPVHRRACRSMERGQDGMVPRATSTPLGHIDRLRPRP